MTARESVLVAAFLLAVFVADCCTKQEGTLKERGIPDVAAKVRARKSPLDFGGGKRRIFSRSLYSKVTRSARRYGLEWWGWQRRHNKRYVSSEEELEKYVVWRSNTAYIHSHNVYADRFGFYLAMNQYGDLVRILQ